MTTIMTTITSTRCEAGAVHRFRRARVYLMGVMCMVVALGVRGQSSKSPAAAQKAEQGKALDLSGTLRPDGVTPEIERAVARGLEYLRATQDRSGCWRSSGNYGTYPCAMTGLAGMALASSGSSTTRGKYAKTMQRTVQFLVRNQHPNGLIAVFAEESQSMYGHGFSTLFLAEMYGMEEDLRAQRQLHRVLTKACELIARSQSAAGGWLYAPDQNGDEGSVTVTQVQALRACRNAGISFPVKTINNAIRYIHDSSNPDGGIRYQARGSGGSRPPITAAAVAVLYNAGKYDDPMAAKALKYAQRTIPIAGGGHHYYSHLYLSQALYQKGGKDWDKYYRDISKWLLRQQRSDGSWMGDGVGTTYGTAIALTILQLPYSYLPIYQR